jgi:hypothetical protein
MRARRHRPPETLCAPQPAHQLVVRTCNRTAPQHLGDQLAAPRARTNSAPAATVSGELMEEEKSRVSNVSPGWNFRLVAANRALPESFSSFWISPRPRRPSPSALRRLFDALQIVGLIVGVAGVVVFRSPPLTVIAQLRPR